MTSLRRSDGDDVAHSTSSTTRATTATTSDMLSTLSAPPMLASDNSSGVLLLGKLMRRDRRLFTWKWRDFVLERSRLQYFSRKGNRKGDIPLTPHTPITIRMCNEPKPFGFLLFINDTKLTLAAATERERHRWIDVFCDVFHASVEQTPADNKAERRARPTYLPIPDLGDDGMDHNSSASNILAHQSTALDNLDAGDGGHSTPVMAHNLLDNDQENNLRRHSFNEDVIPILESRMTYGPIKEMYSRITFPPSLANGDLLVGVGPIVRRMGWTDERILAVGMYIEPETATRELDKFHGRDAKSLYGDHQFYDHLLSHTTFRRSFVVTARKRVSKSVLTALLRDELSPRLGANATALHTFLGLIEKSLKKAESMVMRIHEDGRFEYRLRGQLYPPIASHSLCNSIQAIFFENNSIQHDAKRGLVERLPSLWGGEVLDVQDEIFGSVREPKLSMDSDDNEDSDSDDFEDDSEAEDLFGAAEDETDRTSQEEEREKIEQAHYQQDGDPVTTKLRTSSRSRRHSRVSSSKKNGKPSTKDEWADYDDEELEVMRRESCSLVVHFGPIVDRQSNVMFSGDLAADGSALLGTWSHEFSVPLEELDQPSGFCQHRFSVGLYVDPSAISESLLKYKGLSIGSIVQDADYFRQFSQGKFQKHLIFKVNADMKFNVLLEYFSTRLRSLMSSFEDMKHPVESLVDLWNHAYPQQQQLELCPRDEVRISISADKKVVLRVKKRGIIKDDKKSSNSVSSTTLSSSLGDENTMPGVGSNNFAATSISQAGSWGEISPHSNDPRPNIEMELMLPPPPFYLALESLFFGFNAIDPTARTQLMERIPNLLDLARDDLVHTYHDEIQALRENYKRQKPENRVKVGYLSISFDKRKLQRNADKGGAKLVTVVPSRWSKRWCRLDGTLFSYYSHKRSRKYRDMMELTRCEVVEITANSGPDVARFAWEKGENDSIRIAIIKPNGEILALRTETIYEGEEWLESLTDASKVRRQAGPTDNRTTWDANSSKLQRRSSSNHDQRPDRGPRSESAGADHTERRSSVEKCVKMAALNDNDEDGDDYDSDDEHYEKEGSLLAWVREDTRHGVIAFLIVLIVYLASVMHRSHSVYIERPEVTD
ncbi:chalcone subgroup [Plasmopara halstedii]|uniref:Chalcone subgroup n=1 Tax=Plasmopara halstedii TaxID=4781 RepID=A0A0P1B9B6_PLAHL|nr:chalcone subgroup [Plasmopara halstedii]CEG50488.1 chalcone subgroup [Plasmopara halstedii]|eukprot:XP_024586857.1 chalcone subgroup [Plasmopara halstedii]